MEAKMQDSKIDVAVLLIFFCREKQFKAVFEQVKKARPSRLYLYQDGAREGRESDKAGIAACRKIAEDIDWDCEVHTWYQEKNVGCDPSEFLAQKWMFSTETKGIILEDDDVPAQSFFPYCKELLDRYENDERIGMICGMNNTGISEHIQSSYFYSLNGSIWGWATWRRVVDTWDEHYRWLEDTVAVKNLRQKFYNEESYQGFLTTAKTHLASGRAHYESIHGAAVYLNGQYNIVPKYNMISNIGVGEETTHSVSDIRFLPKEARKLINMKRYEIEFPLVHPDYVLKDIEFEKQVTGSRKKQLKMRIESILLRVRYGDFKYIFKKIIRK